jgi:hypothetical protein
LADQLALDRCPHCGVDKPSLHSLWQGKTVDYKKEHRRIWRTYQCSRCGGVVLAGSVYHQNESPSVTEMYPAPQIIAHPSLPKRAIEYLTQAHDSIHSPAGSVILAASAVDAMLKAKGYTSGKLYDRINKARDDHIITPEMAAWAHEVRLDANDQRHSDDSSPLPSESEAKKSLSFAKALAELLFVLPSRVARGLAESKPQVEKPKPERPPISRISA